MTKRILFVCLGNICRSPAAEGVFIHYIQAKGIEKDFIVDSAGTGGWHVGSPPDSRMYEAAKRRGIILNSFARKIIQDDLKNFDLILTMDADNQTSVKALSKGLGSKATALIKPLLSFSNVTNLTEVPDPYYGGEQGFEKVLDLLEDATKGLLEELIS